MKKNVMAALALFAVFSMHAQEAAVASGGDASGREGSASYSIGQVTYSAPVDSKNSVSEGIQQAYEVSEVLEKDSVLESNLTYTAFPNPTTDVITLGITNYNQENLSYEVVTLSGQLLETGKITESSTAILMKRWAQGTYLLKVTSNQYPVKTFKIIKN